MLWRMRFLPVAPRNVIPASGKPRKKAANEKSPLRGYPCTRETGSAIEIVSKELASRAPGVTVAGEKAQDVPGGRFEHESKTGLVKGSDCGVTVTLNPPDCPEVMMIEDGVARSAIVGLGGASQCGTYGTAPDI